MGISSQPFLVSLYLKDLLLQESTEENKISSYGHLWSKVMAAEAKKQKVNRKSVNRKRPAGRIIMKRRARLIEESRRRRRRGGRGGGNGIERRVRTLKRLIPNSESMGLDGLFRETADYILSLQMRVRVMQVMVELLTAGSDGE